ncbi:MAG: hypothetical protein CVU97_05695 [Firmicutes bacterium HGW-Firmicutes-21]|nr:MAG: hypothetical protein CVU97_05695 [Firmicutes bacterium HGW-Firmicutes-21]
MKRLFDAVITHIGETVAIVIFAGMSAFGFLFENVYGYIFAFILLLYIGLCLLLYINKRKGKLTDRSTAASMPLLRNLLTKLDMPVLIVDEDNRLKWFNKEFSSLAETKGVKINTLNNELFGGLLSFANLSNAYKNYEDFIEIKTAYADFRVHLISMDYEQKKHFATVWYNRTEINDLQKEFADSNVIVAHIVVDNSSEIGQEFEEKNKMTSVKIGIVLSEWAKSIKAILTEYDRDKYIMQFDFRYLEGMIKNRFDILDKVVTATTEESVMPLTVSIGVSSPTGTLADKHLSAQSALQSALQRGGAQTVVKTADGEVSYGGRNKAVQKQTRIRSRVCKDLLLHHIPKSTNVLIMGHARADYDSIASCIGLAKLVRYLGVKVNIIVDRYEYSIKQIFDSLDKIAEYNDLFIDSVYGQELLTPGTLVIISDVSNPDLFEAPYIYQNASRVVVVDHHAIKDQLGNQVLQPANIDPTASSSSELVCEILELALPPNTLRVEEAQILLAGILLDTQNFSRDTGTRTFNACMYLRSEGAEAGKAQLLFKSSVDEFNRVNAIVKDFSIYRDNYAISVYDESMSADNKVAAAKAAERFINIENINASFVLYLMDNGFNLSARSDGTVNVINIAKLLGGGGHFQSAGAVIRRKEGKSFTVPVFDRSEAVALLEAAINEYIDNKST